MSGKLNFLSVIEFPIGFTARVKWIEELALRRTMQHGIAASRPYRRDERTWRLARAKETEQQVPVARPHLEQRGVGADERHRRRLTRGDSLVEMPRGQGRLAIARGPAPAKDGGETGREQMVGERANLAMRGSWKFAAVLAILMQAEGFTRSA